MIKLKYLNPRLAEVGKIKLGGLGEERTSKSGKKYRLPVKYDHFVITTTERDKSTGQFITDIELMKKMSDDLKPKEIPIRLVFDDIDMNFYTTFASYQGKKCFCKGDGEKAEREGKQGKCDPETCKLFQPDKDGKTKCKVSGILSCMISCNPEFGGVYRFRTHSWNSVSNILASLQFISDETNGILKGIPLKLKMLKKTTEEHGDVNIVTIVLDGIEMEEMRMSALAEWSSRKQLGIEMKQIETKALNAGFLVSVDLPEDIQDEYYPETVINDDPIDVTPTTPDDKPTDSEELKEKIEEKVETEKKAETVEPEKDNHGELDIF